MEGTPTTAIQYDDYTIRCRHYNASLVYYVMGMYLGTIDNAYYIQGISMVPGTACASTMISNHVSRLITVLNPMQL